MDSIFFWLTLPARMLHMQEVVERHMYYTPSSAQHPNNQLLADPLGSEHAAPVSDDLHDV